MDRFSVAAVLQRRRLIGYSPLIEVASDARRSFQDAALAAVDRFMEAAHE